MLSDATVLLEQEGAVAWVTLNRPHAMNAVTAELASAIVDVFARLARDDGVRGVVVTGAGERAFCVGADLKAPPVVPGESDAAYLRAMRTIYDMGASIRACPKPVVAAVNGYAIGGGFDIALACDFRVASTSAVFGAGYINVGLIPGDGGTYYLPRLIGEARAKQILMLGERFDAQEAYALGLVSRVVEPGDLRDAAHALADALGRMPATAMALLKRLINESFEMTSAQAMERIVAAQRICLASEEYQHALARFAAGCGPGGGKASP